MFDGVVVFVGFLAFLFGLILGIEDIVWFLAEVIPGWAYLVVGGFGAMTGSVRVRG